MAVAGVAGTGLAAGAAVAGAGAETVADWIWRGGVALGTAIGGAGIAGAVLVGAAAAAGAGAPAGAEGAAPVLRPAFSSI